VTGDPRRGSADHVPDPADARTINCPACSEHNPAVNEFCTGCGAPLGEHTQVAGIVASKPAATWRVYGVETGIFGREAEFQVLADRFRESVAENDLRMVVLTGPEGIGKSRLIARFNGELEDFHDGAHLVTGVARHAHGPAFALFQSLIRARFYIPDDLQGEPARQRLLEAVRATVRSASADEIAHLVGYLIGMPFPASPYYERYDDDQTRILARAKQGLVRLLRTDAEAQPLVLVLDEVHYAGTESLELIEHLHERLEGCPVLVVILARPGLSQRAKWMFQPHPRSVVVPIRDLGDDDVRTLVSDILRRCLSIPEELFELVSDRAYGNPLSVEQILRLLINEGVIDTRSSPWTVDVDRLPDIELPATFEGLVRARLRALTPEERGILCKAAVIGRTFWLEAVQALDRLEQDFSDDTDTAWPGRDRDRRAQQVLEHLNRKDIVRPRSGAATLPQCTEFAFKHDIERKLLLEDLDPARRERYHAVAAQWLEVATQNIDDRSPYLELVAQHHERGLNLPAAARVYYEAGVAAAARYSNQSAAGNFEKALAFLGENALERRIQVLHDLGSVLEFAGHMDEASGWYDELLRTAWLLGHKPKVAVALYKLGRTSRTVGDYDRALTQFKRARTLFGETDDAAGAAACLGEIGKVHSLRGDFDDAETCFQEALIARRGQGDPRGEALVLNQLGAVKLARGGLEDALVLFRQALELRREAGDQRGVAESLNNLAVLCSERGQFDRARALWTESESVANEIGDRNLLAVVLNNLGEVLLRQDHVPEARAALERAVELAEETGDRAVVLDAVRNLGDVTCHQGELDTALALSERAVRIARQLGTRSGEGVALRTLAEVRAQWLAKGRDGASLVEAETSFRDSVAILEEVGHESELARAQKAYGQFLLDNGLAIQGKKRMAQAQEIFDRLALSR
jgi:tetratricopeptide (TPR) repeat protein